MKEKLAVVTGGNGGIGSEVVKHFLARGFKVVVLDRTTDEELPKQINKIKCDIRDFNKVKHVFKRIYNLFGQINSLVNCAGIQVIEAWDEISIDNWNQVINTNLNGTFYCLKEASKYMEPGGNIINISSIHSRIPREFKYSYDATKGAINQLSLELALTLGKQKIKVNIIEPGYIDTPMNRNEKVNISEILNKIPLKRIGKAIDIANLVDFLTSEKATYITGAIVSIDGGRSLMK